MQVDELMESLRRCVLPESKSYDLRYLTHSQYCITGTSAVSSSNNAENSDSHHRNILLFLCII